MQNNPDRKYYQPSTIDHQLSPELQFLIACCQVQPDLEEIALQIKNEKLKIKNWEEIISLSARHGILPLVYKTLKNLSQNDDLRSSLNPQPLVLSTILSELKTHYMSIAQKNIMMSAELLRIMNLLKENNIEALAFKGPVLSQMAYGDITLRQYSDLDILVREEDIYKTAELIVAQDYEPMDSIAFLKNKAKLHVEKNYEFYGRKNGIKVETHRWMDRISWFGGYRL